MVHFVRCFHTSTRCRYPAAHGPLGWDWWQRFWKQAAVTPVRCLKQVTWKSRRWWHAKWRIICMRAACSSGDVGFRGTSSPCSWSHFVEAHPLLRHILSLSRQHLVRSSRHGPAVAAWSFSSCCQACRGVGVFSSMQNRNPSQTVSPYCFWRLIVQSAKYMHLKLHLLKHIHLKLTLFSFLFSSL